MTTKAVHRSPLTSVGTFINVLALGCVGVALFLVALTAMGLPDSVIGTGMIVPLVFATWRAVRLSIRIEGSTIVIRNPWRDYRIDQLQSVTTAQPKAFRGMECLAFVDADGRAVTAIAGTIWMRGAFVERPGTTVERLARFLVMVRAGQDRRFRVDVPPVLREAMRDVSLRA